MNKKYLLIGIIIILLILTGAFAWWRMGKKWTNQPKENKAVIAPKTAEDQFGIVSGTILSINDGKTMLIGVLHDPFWTAAPYTNENQFRVVIDSESTFAQKKIIPKEKPQDGNNIEEKFERVSLTEIYKGRLVKVFFKEDGKTFKAISVEIIPDTGFFPLTPVAAPVEDKK